MDLPHIPAPASFFRKNPPKQQFTLSSHAASIKLHGTPLRRRFRGQKWYQLGTGEERLYKNKNDAGVRGYVPQLGNAHNLLEKLKLSLPKVNTSKCGLNTFRC